jgi:RNA polymerase sigma-70 factor (ECF subfamily)
MASDGELAKRAAAGEREAAGEIYDRYAPLVRAMLLDATGSLPEANDLVQEVFLRALPRLGQLRQPERLCAWLIGIARRQGTDYRRQAGRRRRWFAPLVGDVAAAADTASNDTVSSDTASSDTASSDTASSDTALNDTVDLVRQAIGELPERERIAVHIHYLCGEPAEVARKTLGLSASGFYKLLERARSRLRVRLFKVEQRR